MDWQKLLAQFNFWAHDLSMNAFSVISVISPVVTQVALRAVAVRIWPALLRNDERN